MMEIVSLLAPSSGLLFSPLTFAALIAMAAGLLWLALAPARFAPTVGNRMDTYLEHEAPEQDEALSKPFSARVLAPMLRRLLRTLGQFAPKRNMAVMERLLVQAGEPARLTVLDFFGLRLLCGVLVAFGVVVVLSRMAPLPAVALVALPAGGVGGFMPLFWLRKHVKARKKQILKALPDALDMLTIGVEAGLAFESALLKVAERWDNPLTREFRQAVVEMRVGTPRDTALKRIPERTDVQELRTFVAILVQANQLGLSIAEVLHIQAAQMRMKRRQRAEELARQASIKMLFPLIFLIFPSMMVVVLGPAVPTLVDLIKSMSGGG